MHEAPGVGLAAPQVGIPWRLFVANPTGEPADDRAFINPVLSRPSREMHDRDEGCLSLPEITAQIRRPKAITVTATDLDGREFALTSDDLPARIWQHETDHLDGVLIIDRMTPMDRLANARKLKELEKGMTR
jgi:peptide deformylase